MKTKTRFLAAFLFALPIVASADWNLLIAPANVQTELAAPGVLEMRINNAGADASPAMDLQAGAIAPLLPDYQVNLISGGCGPWRDEMALIIFPATLSVARIAIPAIAPGGNLQCRYSFTALRSDSRNFRLSFAPIDRLNAPNGLIHIGALTDLGATANWLSTRVENGQTVNRYQINVQNAGPNSVAEYGFGACTDTLNFTVRGNFPGGCAAASAGLACFMSGFEFMAGPVQPDLRATCEIETVGVATPGLAAIRLQDSIRRADGRALIDTNPQNDRLSLGVLSATQVPTLSWLGLIGLIFGVVLVTRYAR
jgi:hypothetical protein